MEGQTELRAKDYIPLLGIVRYVARNFGEISDGLESIVGRDYLNRTDKNVLERAIYLAMYNGIVSTAVTKLIGNLFK